DDEINRKVFFLFVETHHQAAEAPVHVPIEVAKIVAGNVVAMVGELDSAAAFLRSSLGAQPPGEHTPADDGQIVELALEIVVEKLFVGRRRGSPRDLDDRLRHPLQDVEDAQCQTFASAVWDRICSMT